MPLHEVALSPFRLDRTEVTNAQFGEFLNALAVKPTGTVPGGKVSAPNIPQAWHAVLLDFSSRPSSYTLIDLDDDEALIGVRDGRFAPNPAADDLPVTETTWAGALAYLDCASRPYGDNAWDGKPVAIMSAAISMGGGVRAQYQLRQCFVFLNMDAVVQPEVAIANAPQRFDEQGKLTDETSKKLIGQLLQGLVRKVQLLRQQPLRAAA
jgi:hypothetical protein